MRTLTPAQAAVRLGITDHAVRDMVRAGRLGNLTAAGHYPYSIPYDDVTRVQHERRSEALRSIGKDNEVEYARKTHRRIWPNTTATVRANGLADPGHLSALMGQPSGRAVLPLLDEPERKLWGLDVLTAAATNLTAGGCRTCLARAAAAVHETLPPTASDAHVALLGPACGTCQAAFHKESEERRTQIKRMGQQAKAAARLGNADRVNAERAAALKGVHQASARFAAANKEWKRLPANLRVGGRQR